MSRISRLEVFSKIQKAFGVNKPSALGWTEWEDWYKEFETTHPVLNWVTEKFPTYLDWVYAHSIGYIEKVGVYIANRKYGTHCLKSTLAKGKWHEYEYRMMYSLFDSFVDYIECEEAQCRLAWCTDEERKQYGIHWMYSSHWLSWMVKPLRCPQAGIDRLKAEMALSDDPQYGNDARQVANAYEKMTIYTWWKHIRPERGDTWAASGLKAFWNDMEKKYGEGVMFRGNRPKRNRSRLTTREHMTNAEHARAKQLSDLQDELSIKWDEEDEQMMIRLIRLRKSLWT